MKDAHRFFRITAAACLVTLIGCTAPPQVSEDKSREAAGKTAVPAFAEPQESVAAGPARPLPEPRQREDSLAERQAAPLFKQATIITAADRVFPPPLASFETESYTPLNENRFINSLNDPLSTFSIDVDTASYSNIRRFLNGGSLPPVGAVRIEEMINYFSYDYQEPTDEPFSLAVDVGPCPWKPEHRLARIGLQAKSLPAEKLPPSNLVFLIDVSGSMNRPNKLQLLKKSMLMLVEQMQAADKIGIVVYAGSDRVVLPPTPGDKKETIRKAISDLTSGGSTHASSAIITAYDLAKQGFIPGGNNRVILASDGDFNVGVTTRGELEKLITDKRQTGVNLTVLGFGIGNYKDDTMEVLADKGNGSYAYIDSLLEAKKVLLKERASSLFTLANDVKIQVEFNPAQVGAYRLIGYENRVMADEDFIDDSTDAGEVGLGHSVTALYELIPAGSAGVPEVDSLKYRSLEPASSSHEIMTVKVRYKESQKSGSRLISQAVERPAQSLGKSSADFRFAAAVAGFGMLLKDSPHKGEMTYPQILELAGNSRGTDSEGYRAEFIRLVETAELIGK